MSIIRRRAHLPPPLPGQPGPFSPLGNSGVLEETYERAGFREAHARAIIPAPLRMASAAQCVRFERELFGALHQMLSGLPESERGAVWEEIEEQLGRFAGADGFEGPCEMVVGSGVSEWRGASGSVRQGPPESDIVARETRRVHPSPE